MDPVGSFFVVELFLLLNGLLLFIKYFYYSYSGINSGSKSFIFILLEFYEEATMPSLLLKAAGLSSSWMFYMLTVARDY